MTQLKRLLAFCTIMAGAMLVAWSFYQGWCRGWGFDLELGNWDPVYEGLAGAAAVAVGTLAWQYFGHAREGVRRRQAFLKALRSCAVLALSGFEMMGVIAAMAGFITFVAIEHAGGNGLFALGICVCGIVAHVAARYLLPWARGGDRKTVERSVANFDDRD